MESLTKRRVTDDELAAMVRRGFGPDAHVTRCRELTDGSYNAAYAITLNGTADPGGDEPDDGQDRDGGTNPDGGHARGGGQDPDGNEIILKVAPPPELKLLTHEVDLMRTEVEAYRCCADAGVRAPAVLFADFDRTVIGSDYTFLSRVPGEPLYGVGDVMSEDDRCAARRQAAALATRLHTVTGTRYGYPLRDSASWRPSWRAAFGAMTDALIADAERLCGPTDGATGRAWAPLPESPERIRELMVRHADALDEVTRPALVHFDLWDGNIFVRRSGAGWRVTGLIDAERAFYGDPLAELVSMTLLREVEDAPEVLDGFAEGNGEPLRLTGPARRRICLYRTYLYLIMSIEARTRGWDDREWMVEPLHRQLALLAAGSAGR